MPEGDSIHRIAERLQPLVGERLEVETPHPRARVLGIARRLDGRRLERVEAAGKNLLLRFEGGLTLRSHLRMKGRWRIQPRGARVFGTPWLVLRAAEVEAVQWNGPVLELSDSVTRRLGPDILAEPPDLQAMVVRLRRAPSLRIAEALQRQELVAGIGNMWAAEALWSCRLSPWLTVADVSDEELHAVLEEAHRLMREALAGTRRPRRAYRRAGRPCPRCGELAPLARPGRRQPDGVLVPRLSARPGSGSFDDLYFHVGLVRKAPDPVLVSLGGANQRMAGLPEVRGRVAAARSVAAAELAAREAHSEVHPAVTFLQALLAAGNRVGQLGEADGVEMGAGPGHSGQASATR